MSRLFDHIDLRVPDLVVAGPFYRALLPALGFTLRVEIDGWLQFEAEGDGATEFFGVTADPAHRPNANRIAFRAASPGQVDELSARLPALGALCIEGPDFEAPDHYAVYFEDPFGNRFEICHRTQKFTSA